MKRRAMLQSLASFVTAARFQPFDLEQAAGFDARAVATLRAIADVVLPSALGADGRASVVDDFVRWHRNYREGADTGHGYGASTLSRPTGPAPSARYPDQLAALDAAARAGGAASFAALSRDGRHAIVEAALDASPRVARLPSRPAGANVIADLMGFWFTSPAAYDLAYEAEIGRDTCRSLDGSDRAPRTLRR